MSAQLSRDEAWSLLTDWVQSESLRRHCLAVATAMEAYARREDADAERWFVVGLLHDMDYERFPDMDDQENGHPRSGMKELESRGVDPEIVRAIASHADFLGVPRGVVDGEDALRRRRAERLPARVRLRAARRASRA